MRTATIDIEKEKRDIVNRYRKLLRKSKPILKEGDSKIIRKAFNVSMEAHMDMRRKSGEPYIFHPLDVALICVEEIGLGTTSIVSALLHDVVEDTDATIEDIEKDFGGKVAKIIDGLTKISGVFEYGSSEQAENFRKMLLSTAHDIRVVLVNPSEVLTGFAGKVGRGQEASPKKLRPEEIAAAVVGVLEIDARGFVPELSVFATNPF